MVAALQPITGFRYQFRTTFGSVEGTVSSCDGCLVRLEGGRSLLVRSVEQMAPLYIDEFKEFSDEKRAALAKKGHALKDGAYPIENEADLGNAVQAYGRAVAAGRGDEVKAHITKRARALGATDKLPADWKGSTKEEAAAQGAQELTVQERIRAAALGVRYGSRTE